jgi:hypothetical protein
MSQQTRTLYRPVGLKEMQLILEADSRAFPERLPGQPFFYPVLTLEYAVQMARDWNTKDAASGFAGFVTAFQVDAAYLRQFEEHQVGGSLHRELWIPAEELAEFNQHIVGRIELVKAFYGSGYVGAKHWRQDWYADELFVKLRLISIYDGAQDWSGEVTLNQNAILLNFKYWIAHDFSAEVTPEEKQLFLGHIAETWAYKFPDVYLLGSDLVKQ